MAVRFRRRIAGPPLTVGAAPLIAGAGGVQSGEPIYDGVAKVLYIGDGDDGSGNATSIDTIGGPGAFVTVSTSVGPAFAPVAAGLAVGVNRGTGQVFVADNGFKPNAFVIGLAKAATSTGFVVDVVRGPVTFSDWTALVGAAMLTPGVPYFLGTGGQLTMTPPTSPACITFIGVALTSTTLNVLPQTPLQL